MSPTEFASTEDPALAAAAAALGGVAAGRGRVYAALAAGFWPPDETLLERAVSGSLAREIAEAVAWIGPDASRYGPGLRDVAHAGLILRDVPAAAALRELRVEHARLFEGPGRPVAIPFESAWIDRSETGAVALNGPSTARVAQRYRQAGLERASAHRELPDHLTVELEFLYELCRRESEAWRGMDDEAARELRATEDRFLRDHAAPWWSSFGERVILQSRHDLYTGFARLLMAHLGIELGEAIEAGMFPWAAGKSSD